MLAPDPRKATRRSRTKCRRNPPPPYFSSVLLAPRSSSGRRILGECTNVDSLSSPPREKITAALGARAESTAPLHLKHQRLRHRALTMNARPVHNAREATLVPPPTANITPENGRRQQRSKPLKVRVGVRWLSIQTIKMLERPQVLHTRIYPISTQRGPQARRESAIYFYSPAHPARRRLRGNLLSFATV